MGSSDERPHFGPKLCGIGWECNFWSFSESRSSSIEVTYIEFVTLKRKIEHRIIWNNQFAVEIQKLLALWWEQSNFKTSSWCWKKGVSFIIENQSCYCKYMFVVWNIKNIKWEHVEFDEGRPSFYPFFVVYHILSYAETWPFLRLLLKRVLIILR